uniref:helix-turn-helix domain-containing protein n=1 Tax=Sphaerisporangium sp. CA-236357 TaxID=3240030 RepID=UPI003F497EB0
MARRLAAAAQRQELPVPTIVSDLVSLGTFPPGIMKELSLLRHDAEKAVMIRRVEHRGRAETAAVNKVRPAVEVPRQIEDAAGYSYKPDPLTATTPGELVDRMRQFRIWAGEPSLRTLAQRSGGAFAASTLCKVLNGERLPGQDLIEAFIRACGGSEEDVQRWVTVRRGLRVPPAKAKARPMAPVTSLPRARSAG